MGYYDDDEDPNDPEGGAWFEGYEVGKAEVIDLIRKTFGWFDGTEQQVLDRFQERFMHEVAS